jgi:hypothetical protein
MKPLSSGGNPDYTTGSMAQKEAKARVQINKLLEES